MLDTIKKSRTQSVGANSAGISEAAAVGRESWNSAHLAALAAQDAYDEMGKEVTKGRADEDEGNHADEDKGQKMEIEEQEQKTETNT